MPKAMSLPIIIKHAGSSHELTIDLAQPGRALKQQIYEATGVPIDRMKVMIKGGMLKDDADLAKLAFKPKQQIMVIGTAGPLPERPKTETVFLEDMDDGELALATRTPAGLVNLGNTCYFAASAQALRSIPSLNESLSTFTPSAATSGSSGSGGSPQLAGALKHLFNGMAQTTEGYAPHHFLGALRQVAPQFAEMGRGGGGYAQQDADECWTTMTNALRAVPGSTTGKSWVEENMMGSMVKELTCDEAPDETPTRLTEAVPKLDCNISITTNYLHQGILASLDQKIEKNSPTLGRTAVYTQKSRLERLPDVLTVHLVRFYWRRDTNSKAKIMRRVKFPHEYDVLDLCTDDLRKRLSPVNAALKQVAKDREERARIRKRARTAANTNTAAAVGAAQADSATDSAAPAASATEGAESVEVYTGTPEEEAAKLAEERSKLASLIDADLRSDKGANKSGLYELAAIVTHKGASADSGHYIGWVKKQAAASALDPSTVHPVGPVSEADEEWHKFDDDKVSIVGRDKIGSLEGGGEDSAAYILVYRSKPLE